MGVNLALLMRCPLCAVLSICSSRASAHLPRYFFGSAVPLVVAVLASSCGSHQPSDRAVAAAAMPRGNDLGRDYERKYLKAYRASCPGKATVCMEGRYWRQSRFSVASDVFVFPREDVARAVIEPTLAKIERDLHRSTTRPFSIQGVAGSDTTTIRAIKRRGVQDVAVVIETIIHVGHSRPGAKGSPWHYRSVMDLVVFRAGRVAVQIGFDRPARAIEQGAIARIVARAIAAQR